jgi:hypothetical protein
MWYAANILTIPTAAVHVPNVLDESGVAGEVLTVEGLSLFWRLWDDWPGYTRWVYDMVK